MKLTMLFLGKSDEHLIKVSCPVPKKCRKDFTHSFSAKFGRQNSWIFDTHKQQNGCLKLKFWASSVSSPSAVALASWWPRSAEESDADRWVQKIKFFHFRGEETVVSNRQ